MERLLRITNVLLGIIAICLVLIVASLYRVDLVPEARAQAIGLDDAKPVYLVYVGTDGYRYPVITGDGKLPTK